MATKTWKVKTPDGNTMTVTAPETATEAEVIAYAKKEYEKTLVEQKTTEPAVPAQQMQPQEAAVIPTEQPADPEEAMMAGAGKVANIEQINADLEQGARLAGNIATRVALFVPSIIIDGLQAAANIAVEGAEAATGKDLSSLKQQYYSKSVDALANSVGEPRNAVERVMVAVGTALGDVITTGGIPAGIKWLTKNVPNMTTEMAEVAIRRMMADSSNALAKTTAPAREAAANVTRQLGEDVGTKAATAVAAAGAGAATQEATDNPALAFAASIAAGLATGRQVTQPKYKTGEEIKQAARSSFDEISQSGVTFNFPAITKLNKDISNGITAAGLNKTLRSNAARDIREELSEFAKEIGIAQKEGRRININDVNTLLRRLTNIGSEAAKKGEWDVYQIAATSKATVNTWLSEATQAYIATGDRAILKQLRDTRSTFRTASRMEILESALKRAQEKVRGSYTRQSLLSATQQEFKKLLRNEKLLKANFGEDEIKQIQQIASGGKIFNALLTGTKLTTGLAAQVGAWVNVIDTSGGSLGLLVAAKGATNLLERGGAKMAESRVRRATERISAPTEAPRDRVTPTVMGTLFGIDANQSSVESVGMLAP